MQTRWGIDLGGTKIEGIVLSKEDNSVLTRLRSATEASKGYDHILLQITELIKQMELTTGLTSDAIGMCTPGTLDPILGVMKNCNTTALNGRDLKGDLEEKQASSLH